MRNSIKWWESKRLLYNVLVGIFGLAAFFITGFDSWRLLSIDDALGVIAWGILANVCYSLGILLEVWNWYYLRHHLPIERFRFPLFLLGLLFSCFYTFASCWLYFAKLT